jgi:hypothetical protein
MLMCYEILEAINPGFKIDAVFAGVYPDKCVARCVNVAPVARNISRHDATKPQRSQRLFITGSAPGIENNVVPYHLPEIKSSEL